jgi:hypothetical protein
MLKFSLVATAFLCLPFVASAQTLSPGDPKMIDEIDPFLAGFATTKVNDTLVTSTGDRYVCGEMNTDGFLAKFDRRGHLIWNRLIDFGTTEQPNALATDASGNLFVVINTGATSLPVLRKYDVNGTQLWQETFAIPSSAADLVVTSTGQPVSFGDYNGGQGPFAQLWNADGSPNPATYSYFGAPGAFTAAEVAPNGCIFVTGVVSVEAGNNNPLFGIYSPDMATTSAVYLPGNGMMTDLVVNPTTGAAFASGWATNGATTNGLIFWSKGSFDSGLGVFVDYAPLSATVDGTSIGGIEYSKSAAGPGSEVYLLMNYGTVSGPKGSYLYQFDSTAGISANWASPIPKGGSDSVGVGVVAHDSKVSVVSMDTSVVSSPDGNYSAYSLATLNSSGVGLRNRPFGNVDQPISSTFDWIPTTKNSVSYGDGVLNVFAPTIGDRAGFWVAGLANGPDDRFVTSINVPLTPSKNKENLLDNDADGFGTYTAQLVTGSATHLAVTVNSDGTFTAVPEAGYAGRAEFQYNVYDGFNYLATHNVVVHVKTDGVGPTTADDSADIDANSSPVTIDVLANDTNPNGGTLTIMSKTNGAMGGQVSIAADKLSLTYRPKKGYTGTDTFTYKVRNAAGISATATVTVNVVQAT